MEEVTKFLDGIGLSIYADVFEENGWGCIRALKAMKESDVSDIIPKKGHVRMILTELQKLATKRSASPSELGAGPSKKSRSDGQASENSK